MFSLACLNALTMYNRLRLPDVASNGPEFGGAPGFSIPSFHPSTLPPFHPSTLPPFHPFPHCLLFIGTRGDVCSVCSGYLIVVGQIARQGCRLSLSVNCPTSETIKSIRGNADLRVLSRESSTTFSFPDEALKFASVF